MGFTGETAAVARTAEVEHEVEIDGWLVKVAMVRSLPSSRFGFGARG